MEKINEEFRIFQGNGKTDFKINIESDYPATKESLELLMQKYPAMSNFISSIYESFKMFDRKDFMFFEGTIEQDGVILPFVNYVCLDRWTKSLEEAVRKGRNFIMIPNRGIELYNLGDYNGGYSETMQTYQQDLDTNHFNRHIFLEKDMNIIGRLYFYYKDGSDNYSFSMSYSNPSRQNLYLSSYGFFNADNIKLPSIIYGGTTIECEVQNYETKEKHGYGMLFGKDKLYGTYIQDIKDENANTILYALDSITKRYKKYKKYTCNKNALSENNGFKEDVGSSLSSSYGVTHVVEQRLPNVTKFAKTLNPIIENPNYYDIPNEIIAISNECVNYAIEKSNGAVLS